jgi:hypothetical protein
VNFAARGVMFVQVLLFAFSALMTILMKMDYANLVIFSVINVVQLLITACLAKSVIISQIKMDFVCLVLHSVLIVQVPSLV